jgi:hypothetical protein
MMKYRYNDKEVEIQASKNNDDYQYLIRLIDIKKHLDHLKQLRDWFNRNNVHTDVMFYVHSDHEYQIIVREDFYTDFLLGLLKFRLVEALEWE